MILSVLIPLTLEFLFYTILDKLYNILINFLNLLPHLIKSFYDMKRYYPSKSGVKTGVKSTNPLKAPAIAGNTPNPSPKANSAPKVP
jgi:hypothetical protein